MTDVAYNKVLEILRKIFRDELYTGEIMRYVIDHITSVSLPIRDDGSIYLLRMLMLAAVLCLALRHQLL